MMEEKTQTQRKRQRGEGGRDWSDGALQLGCSGPREILQADPNLISLFLTLGIGFGISGLAKSPLPHQSAI